MMAVCPEAVDMKRFKDEHWFSRDAVKADKKFGKEIFDVILRHCRTCLRKGKD
jgi:creatinine amidohydrolase/Fe(II)-dependent formamide hydrolase-like protein